VAGVGDLLGLIRDDPPPRTSTLKLAEDAGCGDSTYQTYDDKIVDAAEAWLRRQAERASGKPWVLFVSLVCPHFPLIARPEWYGLYPEKDVPWPFQYAAHERPDHPFFRAMGKTIKYDDGFDEQKVRKAIAAYYGLVSFLDHNVGRLIRALKATGLADSTRVIYTSDHGDNLGARGLWGKSNMYEDAAGVPLIMAGPDIPHGFVCREPVSLVDGFPTILDCVGAKMQPADRDLPSTSLFDVMRGTRPSVLFSEYHASGSVTGVFMIRKGPFKYVDYVGMPPQLFDLENDPLEAHDLGQDPGYAGVIADCASMLRRIVDPDEVDRQARQDQRARVEAHGGREAIIARGTFGYSPVPGTEPVFS
jgi:choline-sulfatase